jgi:uncharacterized membrane protein
VKVGVVILFFGVSFLVKYAAQHGLFPLELRLTAAALGGCALITTGWRLRDRRAVYAQVIQGGGSGILYITTFAAMRLYHLIPTALGFVLLVAICALTAVLALMQNSRPLALLGTAGGFLAPELASIGSGSPVALFGYYAVLNTGIIGIAWSRAWRSLNLLGFLCTFLLSLSWGFRFYQPEFFASVEPFLVLFFLLYTAVAVLFTLRQPETTSGYLDEVLLFGTPVVAFFLQAGLVRQFEFGLAWSAFAVGLFYLSIAVVLFQVGPRLLLDLCDAYLAFGVLFTTLAIPLAFDGRWTAAAWCMEGAAMVWAGLRQERQMARGFGYLLLVGAGIAFLGEVNSPTGSIPILNGFYCGCLMVSCSALFTAYTLHRNGEKLAPWETGMETLLFAWGMAWWFVSGLTEINRQILDHYRFGGHLALIALSCTACQLLRKRLAWKLLDYPALGLLPSMVLLALSQILGAAGHPAADGGFLAWPLAFALWYPILRQHEDTAETLLGFLHAAGLWLLTGLSAWEISWQIGHRLPGMETWALTAWGVVPAGLALLVVRKPAWVPWPATRHRNAYLGLGSGPLILFAWLWCLCVNLTHGGNPWPLPYLPLANPLDCATALVLVTLAAWYQCVTVELHDIEIPREMALTGYGATVFLWLNAILLRTIHHWCGVPFTPGALFASTTVQASLSIFWCLLALAIMTVATRRSLHSAWIAGAALLTLVVGKLFLVDLASHGTIARIISFVVVGILLLVIGWFAPVPPRTKDGGAAR